MSGSDSTRKTPVKRQVGASHTEIAAKHLLLSSGSLHLHSEFSPAWNSVGSQVLFSGPVSILSNTLYTLATRFHLIPSSGPDVESGYSQVPGGARAEAERRR